MEKLNKVDARKFYEYKEILQVLRETISEKDPVEIRLNNHTLRTMAGYTEDSNEQNFNPYVKRYLDKLAYDEHNKKVEKAKKSNDSKALQELSDRMMNMAGYTRNSQNNFNEYARSFVDRTFFDRKISKLYAAMQKESKEDVDSAYRDIYSMTSYSENKPYGIVNEYAQTYVDTRMSEFIKKGIHTPQKEERCAL